MDEVQEQDQEQAQEPTQEQAEEEEETFGEYAIVSFELQGEGSDALDYSTVEWGYETEEDAWDALEGLAEAGELGPGDYGVIQLCSGREPFSID